MFRKPREQAAGITPKPSVGRAPTPPPSERKRTMPKAASKPKPKQSQLSSFFNKSKEPLHAQTKSPKQQNDSILSFFKKVDSPAYYERSLFIDEETPTKTIASITADSNATTTNGHDNGQLRYNENSIPHKRRRTASPPDGPSEVPQDGGDDVSNGLVETQDTSLDGENKKHLLEGQTLQRGPFAEDSDSDEDAEIKADGIEKGHVKEAVKREAQQEPVRTPLRTPSPAKPNKPTLIRESTSFIEEDEFDKFENVVEDEFYEDGEEYLERRYMEEQAALEREFEDDDLDVEEATALAAKSDATATSAETEASCPICNETLAGVSSQEASVHVNNCLDGNPSPLPTKKPNLSTLPPLAPSAKRFQRAAIPRPGQPNPYSLAPTQNCSSAFSRLMASHAEDEAWAAAAANEVASRGKPAFKRTCPFYKILPGFFICVDAFRYGAVEGCNAYFLSHFHSDHYIGLTSSWCHGPIFCSRVTGNLVRQQLRVDPKWVVDLEWDKKIEVPNTEGVNVTMIPANHCPGSSLFLFEKAMDKGPNPRLQRVLHCGDFRACTAHVQHPLLRPDVIDAVSGKKRQQKLNVCYLDTTYLTPKYAFPPQESVIKACADMCVSLSKDKIDEMDAWERTKKARAGSGMVKFVQKDGSNNQDKAIEGASNDQSNSKGRGRLLVVVGTYSIGKERMCLGIARALQSKIFAPPSKKRICLALEDPELTERLTDDPYEAQIHMQMLMEIRPETLADYLTEYKPYFSRIVGFRPTGWSYRPPNSRFVESPLVQTVLHSDNWKTSYSMTELVPQRGSTRESNCFGVPYSEHSSFRELTMFCCALRIDKIIPTVNVGSPKSRERMKGWIEKWSMEKKKNGLFKVEDDAETW